MNGLKIRDASISDVSEIASCSKQNLPISYSVGDLVFMFIGNYEIIVAVIDNKIIGYIVADIDNDNVHIHSFAIDKEFRRIGIGHDLMTELENKVKDKCKTMSLYVHIENLSGKEFYKKYGFEKVIRIKNYYQGHLKNVKSQDALKLVKIINKGI